MLFNSIDFAVFLPIVFAIYWIIQNRKYQNFFLLVSSYVFYGWWDWRFLSLIFLSSVVDFSIGLKLKSTTDSQKRKYWLWLSLFFNLGLLGFFKYFNFFVENYKTAFSFFGHEIGGNSLNIILPVGISFYTFQTLSYTIDVYRKQLEPTRDFISFASFVSFFPQLVAGPIERATRLLPQFFTKRNFTYESANNGLRQILWGLFKKVVIADNCAYFADLIFDNSANLSGSTLILGAFFFTFQIYGDFSGYSDIAIGTARLFGFNLTKNFAFPYFSRDIAEFWRRWHISLSTWFRDYLYIPLGGSRVGTFKKVRNVFAIFLVSGFWHGANWTFIVWGALNALFFLPLLLRKSNRTHLEIVAKNRWFPHPIELLQILSTFGLTTFAWIFFRAESLTHALDFISNIFDSPIFELPKFKEFESCFSTLYLLAFFIIIEWLGREGEYAIHEIRDKIVKPIRWFFYSFLIFLIGMFMTTNDAPFIYFQF